MIRSDYLHRALIENIGRLKIDTTPNPSSESPTTKTAKVSSGVQNALTTLYSGAVTIAGPLGSVCMYRGRVLECMREDICTALMPRPRPRNLAQLESIRGA